MLEEPTRDVPSGPIIDRTQHDSDQFAAVTHRRGRKGVAGRAREPRLEAGSAVEVTQEQVAVLDRCAVGEGEDRDRDEVADAWLCQRSDRDHRQLSGRQQVGVTEP